MLFLACIMGGAAVFLARGWLERQMPAPVAATAAPKAVITSVVVAKLPLRFGDELNRDNLRLVEWPAGAVPEGAFTTIDEVLSGKERRVALRDIAVNELVLKGRVSGFGGRATLSALLDLEMRAVTIRVNDVNGVAGFVLPGDRVDLMFTRPANAASGAREPAPPVTDVLLQNLKVLAVDQVADSLKDQPVLAKAVTVEVSTEEAQKVTLASQVGTLSLALRNFGNTHAAHAATVTVDGLLSRPVQVASTEPAPTAEAPAPAPSYQVRIVRGTQATSESVTPELPRKAVPGVDRVAWAGRPVR